MRFFRNIKLWLAGCFLLVSAAFAETADVSAPASRFHVGLYASGGYIGIWNLEDDLYVKRIRRQFQEEDGQRGRSYRVQYLTGGHDMRGYAASIGGATAYDVNSWLTLRADLYLSIRTRYVNATEYNYKIVETFEDAASIAASAEGDAAASVEGNGAGDVAESLEVVASRDSAFGSKGKYDISLTYVHVDLPLAARFNLPKAFYVEGGVMLSYIAAANLEMSLISLDMNSYSAGAELGILGTAGRRFVVKNRNLDVFGKFTFGVTPLLTDNVRNFIYQSVHLREWILEVGAVFWLL